MDCFMERPVGPSLARLSAALWVPPMCRFQPRPCPARPSWGTVLASLAGTSLLFSPRCAEPTTYAEERSDRHPRSQAAADAEAGRADGGDHLRFDEVRPVQRRQHRNSRAWRLPREELR